jgi:hypothetical protein
MQPGERNLSNWPIAVRGASLTWLAALIFLTQPTQADVFGDIGNAISGGLSAVGNAITGGVESVLGFGSQGLVGPILSGALDPVIGKFSDAVQKAGTNVVDYATGKFGDLADKEITNPAR